MNHPPTHLPKAELFGVVLWPAFLAAALTVGIVFTLIDPESIHLFGSQESVSRQAAYTIGFFGFWVIYAATSFASLWLHLKNTSRS
jgi:hypothetical protein